MLQAALKGSGQGNNLVKVIRCIDLEPKLVLELVRF
jgi:hypothetical protein